MAYTRKTKTENEVEYLDTPVEGIKVVGDSERFSLSIGIVKIHGCRLVDGKNGTFIGMPRWKDSRGEWHNTCSLYLEESDNDKLVEFIDNL